MPPAAMASRVRTRHVAGVLRLGAATAGLAEAQLDEGGPGELRRGPEATPFGVEAGAEAGDDAARQHGRRARRRLPRPSGVGSAAPLGRCVGLRAMASARRISLRTAPTSASACARTWSRVAVPRLAQRLRRRGGTTACRGAPRAGSRSRRRRAARRACRRPTWASHPTRSAPGWPPCRPRRGRDAPPGPP